MKKQNALLFDTRSIQNYIYSGNLLRTNIGASFIVDRVFYDILIEEVLKDMFPEDDFGSLDDSAWNVSADEQRPWTQMKSCCVAYIGGGNILLLLDSSISDDVIKEVVRRFTRRLLCERPGLRVGVAQGQLTLNVETQQLDQEEIDLLYAELKKNQNTVFPAVNVPYTGLTLSCEVNGEAANFYGTIRKDGGKRFYSQEVAVKSKISDYANKDLKRRFDEIFATKKLPIKMDNYEFPLDFSELGQKEQENYFAIVHVDGNNMGLKFRTCNTLTERRRLSREIRRKTEGAFADLLEKIIKMVDNRAFAHYLNLKTKTLPIRPLILGGDDVTFVCPANMAIMFTKTLMELMTQETPKDAPEHLTSQLSRQMDCCAGIAILPTSYPFSRGYTLAEQLCDSAKKAMRLEMQNSENKSDADKEKDKDKDNEKGSSWLDFAILHGEQAPTLEQIRDTEYKSVRGNMHFGPYRVANSTAKSRYNIENLLNCTTQFLFGKMANNKVKELRNVLQHGKDETARFLRQLSYQGQELPDVSDWNDLNDYDEKDKNLEDKYLLWTKKAKDKEVKTPYVDAIELMDFYIPEVMAEWQNLK